MQGTSAESMLNKLKSVYGVEKGTRLHRNIDALVEKYRGEIDSQQKAWVDQEDIMLITYGDSIKEAGKAPLQSLHEFLEAQADGTINAVHLLPFYPYSSDDGFSVIDYLAVNPDVGTWKEVEELSNDFDLMFDAVINHISQKSDWFQGYLNGDPDYKDYFIAADPKEDYSQVTRPRALPLLTKFETTEGPKYIWTTFSEDQIDLNFESEKLFLTVLEVLLTYVKKGARFLRLDAIGFLWKKIGTSCIHLEETHTIVQIIREVLETVSPGTVIITETNVPHQDNISYFGDGTNEAHLVYQFPLPPLTLHSFQQGTTKHLLEWADSLDPTTAHTTYFNFLASHDGIGVRPVEGILSETEVGAMIEKVEKRGGRVSYKDNGDGTKSPYELNINYLDALVEAEDSTESKVKRFLAAQSILLSMVGVPGIYVHSLLGSRNYEKGIEESGRYRTINREKLDRGTLEKELADPSHLRHQVFEGFKRLIDIRKQQIAFHPNAHQKVLFLDDRVFSIIRSFENEQVVVLINVTAEDVVIQCDRQLFGWDDTVMDLVRGKMLEQSDITLEPFQVMWLKG
ncbi:sucrose phosphorylase [Thalassobacillus devorans]|uniref:Sucrose phosphorylase n=1 Tax=Thalassobacillus devorans TaxID=279813 RepID=A0ABQ1NSH5_9BACI|nr:sugar phosphorylase [Thalassobacillus devorans]NIK28681.1 sucrose phosphorylase [Thalassobacillus devorans]GGC84358.1 sucrose phosphorylase [Thalassobacillus devorans]